MIWEYFPWISICTGHPTIQGKAPVETLQMRSVSCVYYGLSVKHRLTRTPNKFFDVEDYIWLFQSGYWEVLIPKTLIALLCDTCWDWRQQEASLWPTIFPKLTAGTPNRWMSTRGQSILRSKPCAISYTMKLDCRCWSLRVIASRRGR